MPPIANYVPYVVTGNLVVVSGQVPASSSDVSSAPSGERPGQTSAIRWRPADPGTHPETVKHSLMRAKAAPSSLAGPLIDPARGAIGPVLCGPMFHRCGGYGTTFPRRNSRHFGTRVQRAG